MHKPNPLQPVRSPVCPDCRKPMRFTSAKPDRTLLNLRHALFMCDCGRVSDQVIMDEAGCKGIQCERGAQGPGCGSAGGVIGPFQWGIGTMDEKGYCRRAHYYLTLANEMT